MQQSMTGFGYSECIDTHFIIRVELKTINSKFIEINLRLPQKLYPKELELKNKLTDSLKRGKIMCSIILENPVSSDYNLMIDEEVLNKMYSKMLGIAKNVNADTNNLFSSLLKMPGVMKPIEASQEEPPWKKIEECLHKAIDKCVSFRKQEGKALLDNIESYLLNIKQQLSLIESMEKQRITKIRSRITTNLTQVKDKVPIDKNRLEQEIILYLERLDISEERVRLYQHISCFLDVLYNENNVGKKLGFITQEIGREINTIGAKANDADIQHKTVIMKDELEKIKEQLLNIL